MNTLNIRPLKNRRYYFSQKLAEQIYNKLPANTPFTTGTVHKALGYSLPTWTSRMLRHVEALGLIRCVGVVETGKQGHPYYAYTRVEGTFTRNGNDITFTPNANP